MRNIIQLPEGRTQQRMKEFYRDELHHKGSTIDSNVSRLNKVAERLGTSVDELHLIPVPDLKKLTAVFLGKEIIQNQDYNLRRTIKLYNQYASSTNAVQSIVLPIPKRSEIGYERFLRKVYVRKTGEGEMLTVPQYLSYIRAFEKALGMYEGQIHTLSRRDVTLSVKKLEDIRKTLINSRHYLSAASTYEDYVAYSLGTYLPNVAA